MFLLNNVRSVFLLPSGAACTRVLDCMYAQGEGPWGAQKRSRGWPQPGDWNPASFWCGWGLDHLLIAALLPVLTPTPTDTLGAVGNPGWAATSSLWVWVQKGVKKEQWAASPFSDRLLMVLHPHQIWSHLVQLTNSQTAFYLLFPSSTELGRIRSKVWIMNQGVKANVVSLALA